MGWNGSDLKRESTSKQTETQVVRTHRPILFFIIAALALVGAVALLLYFTANDASEQATVKQIAKKPISARERMMRIVEAKTGRSFNPSSPKAQKAESLDLGWYTNKLGEVKRRTGKIRLFYPGNSMSLFQSPAEDQISTIVNSMAGDCIYDEDIPEDFEEQFAYSLTNRIVISENDSDSVAEQKRRVIEAKERLVELKNQGKDLRKVLMEEKKYLKQKFDDFVFFEQGLDELRANNASVEEIADYAIAAKQMMKEKEIESFLNLDESEFEEMKKIDRLVNGQTVESNEIQNEEVPQ